MTRSEICLRLGLLEKALKEDTEVSAAYAEALREARLIISAESVAAWYDGRKRKEEEDVSGSENN